MLLSKPKSELKIAVLIPAYKREEYTQKCMNSMRNAQEYTASTHIYCYEDGSYEIPKESSSHPDNYDLRNWPNRKFMGDTFSYYWDKFGNKGPLVYLKFNDINKGLRNVIIDFFEEVIKGEYDIIAKIDNDCLVPKNWLNDLLDIFEKTDVDILSPNVYPSNAAVKYGKKVEGLPYLPAQIVGGLWCMKTELIKDMLFQRHEVEGLTGAVPILRQIINEKEPKIGWLPDVIVQDLGHWTGEHPECIKTKEHEMYYAEVGREIAWNA